MSIQDLNSKLVGGLRPNRFKIDFTLPAGVTGDTKALNVLAKGYTLPGQTVGQIEYKYRGQTNRIAGDRVVDSTWTVTMRIPNTAKDVLEMIDTWAKVAAPVDGTVADPVTYKTNMSVELLGTQDSSQAKYALKGCWITTTPALSGGDDSADEIMEVDITFSIDEIELS